MIPKFFEYAIYIALTVYVAGYFMILATLLNHTFKKYSRSGPIIVIIGIINALILSFMWPIMVVKYIREENG